MTHETHDYAALKQQLEQLRIAGVYDKPAAGPPGDKLVFVTDDEAANRADLRSCLWRNLPVVLAALEAAQQVDPEWKRLRLSTWENRALKAEAQVEKLTDVLETVTTFLHANADTINHALASDDDGPFGNHVGDVLAVVKEALAIEDAKS